MKSALSETLTEGIYRRLKKDVVAGVFKPDQKLKISDISEYTGASPSLVREVLSRLIADGLVIAEPQKGFRTAPLKLAEFEQLTEARIAIESMCLRDAILHGDIRWESDIVSALHALRRAKEEKGSRPVNASPEWVQSHALFHQALVRACQNIWFLRMREMLYIQSERFRAIALPVTPSERNIGAEHEGIAAATIARDARLAVDLLTNHLQSTMRVMMNAATYNNEKSKESPPIP